MTLALVFLVYWIGCAVPTYLSMRKGMFSFWPFYLVAIVLSPFIMPCVWIEAFFNKIDPPKTGVEGILRRELIEGALFAIGLFALSGVNYLVMTGKL